LTTKPRVITVGNFSTDIGKIQKFLKAISKFKGIYYIIQNYNAPMSFSYVKEYYLNGLNDPEQRRILGKGSGNNFEPYPVKDHLGTILLQSKYEDERADFFGFSKERLYLGYFKLHDAWLEKVKQYSFFENNLLEQEDSIIVIVTKKSGKYLFDSEDTYLTLLKETVKQVRKYYPDRLIVIKPKPFKRADTNDWIPPFVDSLNDKKITIDYTPLTFTATKTIVALFNIPSTAYFDFVINNVPCIEHVRYGENHKKVHPNDSYLQEFGAIKTSNVEELDKAISTVKDGTFKIMSNNSLKKHIEHNDDKNTFETL
jgi:hypothetical protein